MTGWTSVRVQLADADPDARSACLAALFAHGAQGVHEDGRCLVTHFPPHTDLAGIERALCEVGDGIAIENAPVPDVDWSEAWKRNLRVHDLGAIAISPPWLAGDADPARTVVIDPGMAFGTGDHATTRGVVRLMASVIRDGDIVADLGAGSAVLSIAAAKLGASRVYAIEMDHDAIADAEENVRVNGVVDRVHVFEADAATLLPLVGAVRVVLANIISSVLMELLPVVEHVLDDGGTVIVSGILRDERFAMLEYLASNGWRVVAEDAEDIWWSAAVERG